MFSPVIISVMIINVTIRFFVSRLISHSPPFNLFVHISSSFRLASLSVCCSASFKDTLLNDIRKAREKYQGEELAKELSRIKLRIDNTEVLTQDIVMNLLFSYRDIQVQTHTAWS